jgi:hypothetical protein
LFFPKECSMAGFYDSLHSAASIDIDLDKDGKELSPPPWSSMVDVRVCHQHQTT